jgi:hypothetical protein
VSPQSGQAAAGTRKAVLARQQFMQMEFMMSTVAEQEALEQKKR